MHARKRPTRPPATRIDRPLAPPRPQDDLYKPNHYLSLMEFRELTLQRLKKFVGQKFFSVTDYLNGEAARAPARVQPPPSHTPQPQAPGGAVALLLRRRSAAPPGAAATGRRACAPPAPPAPHRAPCPRPAPRLTAPPTARPPAPAPAPAPAAEPRRFMAALEVLSFCDYSLAIKAGVHFTLCGGTICKLGTAKHHQAYLPRCARARGGRLPARRSPRWRARQAAGRPQA
jgi:hypothetical protein